MSGALSTSRARRLRILHDSPHFVALEQRDIEVLTQTQLGLPVN